MKIDRSPQYEESGLFLFLPKIRSWRVKVIKGHYHFQIPKIPVIKVKVIKVIKDFGFQKYPSTSLYLIK